MIDRYTDRLSEYLDGDMDPRDEALIETHLVDCATCRATLAELRAVVARAAALPPAEPSADLWPGIRARIESDLPSAGSEAQTRVGAGPTGPTFGSGTLDPRVRSRPRRRVSFSVPQLAAASIALALASGTAVWVTLNLDRAEPAPAANVHTLADNPSAARFIEYEQRNTIAELERALDEQRDSLDPVTVAVLESNLGIIDAAIVQAMAALESDPGNNYLNRHLGNTVEKKIDVLRRATQVARAEI